MQKIEIEQKYLFYYLPYNELPFCQKTTVYRKYLSFDPEVRIHKRVFETEERYHLTIKQENILKRNKIKVLLTKNEFEEIFDFIEREPLIMDVYDFKFDIKHIISFKVCKNYNIKFAEIEYSDDLDFEINSTLITKLPFIGKEVTYNKDYYAKNIYLKL